MESKKRTKVFLKACIANVTFRFSAEDRSLWAMILIGNRARLLLNRAKYSRQLPNYLKPAPTFRSSLCAVGMQKKTDLRTQPEFGAAAERMSWPRTYCDAPCVRVCAHWTQAVRQAFAAPAMECRVKECAR